VAELLIPLVLTIAMIVGGIVLAGIPIGTPFLIDAADKYIHKEYPEASGIIHSEAVELTLKGIAASVLAALCVCFCGSSDGRW